MSVDEAQVDRRRIKTTSPYPPHSSVAWFNYINRVADGLGVGR